MAVYIFMGTKWGMPYEHALREIAKEAVMNAMKQPYEATESQYTVRPEFEVKR